MPYYLVKLRNAESSSDSPVVMVSFVVLHVCGWNSISHLPNYLKGCIQYTKLLLLRGLETVKVGSLYPQFFFGGWFPDSNPLLLAFGGSYLPSHQGPHYLIPPTPKQKRKRKHRYILKSKYVMKVTGFWVVHLHHI